jgi:hypothetical protein
MGTLVYGSAETRVTVDDRALAHLKVVIVTKFRRNEAFLFSWDVPAERGSGRGSIWLHPAIPLRFEFGSARPPSLNRAWLEEMTISASTSIGLVLGDEPVEQPAA